MADDSDSFELQASDNAFLQDLHPWVIRTANAPGCRRLSGARVVTLRHAATSTTARDALRRCGLPWPAATGALEVVGHPLVSAVTRRQPEELLLIGSDAAQADALLAALGPGRASDAVAVDLTHGMLVLALEGPQLELWLSHLVDAGAIPRGSATRTRLADIAVVLMRLNADTVWLVVDRSLAPYLANWLAFTHEGAFPKTA